MDIANHDWRNQLNSISVCNFPDCKNDSRCICSVPNSLLQLALTNSFSELQ